MTQDTDRHFALERFFLVATMGTIQCCKMMPDDIEQLKAMLLKLVQEKQAMAQEVTALKTQVQLLVEQLNLSKSKRFNSQSQNVAKGEFNEADQQNTLHSSSKERKKQVVNCCLLTFNARCKPTP